MSPLTPGEHFEALVALIARLRGPGGCPWDREQTHESLKSMTLEEAYEVVEAIDGSDADLRGELGDLLLQVVFHSQIASEGGRFDISGVIGELSDKMVRRHPHVFGGVQAETPGEVLKNWEAIKGEERAAKGVPSGALESVSTRLPGLMEAFQVSTKASRLGFDWPDAPSVLAKLDEEVAELKHAISESDHGKVSEEVGDLLFMVANVARFLNVDPESALKAANRKFRRRFHHVETGLAGRGRKLEDASLEEMEALWQEAKAQGL